MADNLTAEQRRKNMQNICSANTHPERLLQEEFTARKLKFSHNDVNIYGKPDFVFKQKKVVVFVDSDFWHGHPKRFVMPKTNVDYWKEKIARNRRRDREVNKVLKERGWVVIRLWDHNIKHHFKRCLNKVLRAIE